MFVVVVVAVVVLGEAKQKTWSIVKMDRIKKPTIKRYIQLGP